MKKLYLKSWDYNAALILQNLEQIARDHGAEIVTSWKRDKTEMTQVINRTLSGAIRETAEMVDSLAKNQRPALEEYRRKLEKLEAIPNTPVIIPEQYTWYHHIGFVLDGYYYYYGMDSNPFFNFTYCKTPVTETWQYNRNTYHENDKKEWLVDILFSYSCTDQDRRKAAQAIFEMLTRARPGHVYRDKNRITPGQLYRRPAGEDQC